MASFVIDDQFWTGETGRAIKAAGKDAQLLAIYLMSNMEANKIGLYYFSFEKANRFLALTREEAEVAMNNLCIVDFCQFDTETGMVFIKNMASYQIGFNLRVNDNRIVGVHNELKKFPKNDKLVIDFIEYNQDRFHIKTDTNNKPEIIRTDLQQFVARLNVEFANSGYIHKQYYRGDDPNISTLYNLGVTVEELVNEARVLYERKGQAMLEPRFVYVSVIKIRQKAQELSAIPAAKGEVIVKSKFNEPLSKGNYVVNERVL